MDIQRDEDFEKAYSEICKPIIARPYPRNEKGEYIYQEIHEAYLMWQAKAQAVPEWISVEDKEPDCGETVLICWSDSPEVEPEKDYMDIDIDTGALYWSNYNDGDEPSHWMPLPQPVAQEQMDE